MIIEQLFQFYLLIYCVFPSYFGKNLLKIIDNISATITHLSLHLLFWTVILNYTLNVFSYYQQENERFKKSGYNKYHTG